MKNKRLFSICLAVLILLDVMLPVLFSIHASLSLYSLFVPLGVLLLLLIAYTIGHGTTYSTGVNLRKDETELFCAGYRRATVLFLVASFLFVFFFEGTAKLVLFGLYLVIAIFGSALVGKANAKEAVKLRLQREEQERNEQIAREEGVYFKK